MPAGDNYYAVDFIVRDYRRSFPDTKDPVTGALGPNLYRQETPAVYRVLKVRFHIVGDEPLRRVRGVMEPVQVAVLIFD